MESDLVNVLNEMKAGKEEAFETFFTQVEKRAFAYGMRVCGGVEEARETTQETMLNTFQALPKLEFKDSKAFNAWLYQVAKNCCLMMRRHSKHRTGPLLSLDQLMLGREGESSMQEFPDPGDLPDEALLHEEVRLIVRRAIQAIPWKYRLVLLLRDIEGYSTREVADLLEISEENVKIRLHRARTSLRHEMEGFVALWKEEVERP